jgi:hypothetical protein
MLNTALDMQFVEAKTAKSSKKDKKNFAALPIFTVFASIQVAGTLNGPSSLLTIST